MAIDKNGYYSSGSFANKAHVTKKTLRYYDEHNILKPSFVNEKGVKFYTDKDFAKLQQIIFLKNLSFPLKDIKELTIRNEDKNFWLKSLAMQTSFLEERIEQLTLMKEFLKDAELSINAGEEVNWSEMLLLANTKQMEERLKKQYINSSNIKARINLHNLYSNNTEGWFPWVFKNLNLKDNDRVLELGAGDGSLWALNKTDKKIDVTITDISQGIIKETALKLKDYPFNFKVMNALEIDYPDNYFDIVIANHLLFYVDDLDKTLKEIRRVLKPNGRLISSTYGTSHMLEINELVKEFDDRIKLSKENLYERFGKENGKELLSSYFKEIEWRQFEDSLFVDQSEPLVEYIISCHGNQNKYIVDQYHEFLDFVKNKVAKGFKITKDAGIFISKK